MSDWEGGVAVLTIGLFCLSGECTGDFFDTTTDSEGRYALDLTGDDTQSAFGEAVSFQLSTSAAPRDGRPSGAAVAARFRIQTTDVRMPELQLVDPLPAITGEGPVAVVRYDAGVAPGPVAVEFEDVDRAPVWAAAADGGEFRLDARLLEDAVGVASVAGRSSDAIEGSAVDIRWRSSTVGFRGGVGPPPSRGAPCEVVTATGRVEPLPDCGLTDGSFSPAVLPGAVCDGDGRLCEPAEAVRIRLPSPVEAELVAVRGCEGGCRVRVFRQPGSASEDVGAVSDRFGTVALDRSPISGVDVSLGDSTDLAEVSVWPVVSPDSRALRPVDEALDRSPLVQDDGSASDALQPWVIAAAGLLLVAVVLGAGIAIGRRTRRS